MKKEEKKRLFFGEFFMILILTQVSPFLGVREPQQYKIWFLFLEIPNFQTLENLLLFLGLFFLSLYPFYELSKKAKVPSDQSDSTNKTTVSPPIFEPSGLTWSDCRKSFLNDPLYKPGGRYAWPYTRSDAITFTEDFGYSESLSEFGEIFETSSDDVNGERNLGFENEDLQRCDFSKVEDWPFENLLISAFYYFISSMIEKLDLVSSDTWSRIFECIVQGSPFYRKEYLELLDKYHFFIVSPFETIQGLLKSLRKIPVLYFLFRGPDEERNSFLLTLFGIFGVPSNLQKEFISNGKEEKKIQKLVSFLEARINSLEKSNIQIGGKKMRKKLV